MDSMTADLALQAVLGRGGDFVGGIDNEALDFSQLEAFINSEGSQGNNGYFGESLNPPSGKLLNVIVENKRPAGHSLPESPPDSSSEHPYSPQDSCNSETIYTTLGQSVYKPNLLNPIISDNLILGSHIVVAEQTGDNQLLENGNLLPDGRIIVNANNNSPLLNTRIVPDSDSGLLISEEPNRQILIQSGTDSNQSYTDKSQLVHMGFSANLDLQSMPNRQNLDSAICEPGMQTVYTNLQSAPKKRKLSQDVPLVKSEPGMRESEHCPPSQLSPPGPGPLSVPVDEEYAASEGCLSESQYQCIRFQPFQQNNWHTLCDQNLTELPTPHYRVDADKGFNFSNADDAFVCQKKNHFQITCHVQLLGDAQFVKTAEGFQKISSFHLHFYGVKHDCPTQTIRVEQSQSDRSKKPFHPVLVELVSSQVTKVTVGRLHFSETTSNNMRKKGKPNPEQRYFQLVVGLHAHTSHGNFPVISHASQKIIVRASNPGQFESDVELCWQKGQTQDSIYHAGKVGINTDRPDESLVVHGNLKITGHIVQPSDVRAKKNIVECDTAEQLRNVQRLRVVRYKYEPEFATQLKRKEDTSDTGVIAQEVAEILPEAVSLAGDLILENGTLIDNFLVVNKERIFMENIGAVKELCKVTENLETRIDQLERINRRLNKLKRGDSLKSNSTVSSTKQGHSIKFGKQHTKCHKETELCSTKFIQIIVVVLVLIMACCLAAITTLYLMEAERYSPPSLQTSKNSMAAKRPSKSTKLNTWHVQRPQETTPAYKEAGLLRIPPETLDVLKKSPVIGRPSECELLSSDQDFEAGNPCQIYCCSSSPVDTPEEFDTSIYLDKKPAGIRNKTTILILDKNRVSKPFHSNDIDKQSRQKRDSKEFKNQENTIDEQSFTIIIQGRNFNVTLNSDYLSSNNNGNYTYSVPVSKYMPDEYVSVIFRTNIKNIEHCNKNYDIKPDCSYASSLRKINENSSSQQQGLQVAFEVDLAGFQYKTMTYRASLRQYQSVCKLSATKVGLEFVEYNFNFYRYCDE